MLPWALGSRRSLDLEAAGSVVTWPTTHPSVLTSPQIAEPSRNRRPFTVVGPTHACVIKGFIILRGSFALWRPHAASEAVEAAASRRPPGHPHGLVVPLQAACSPWMTSSHGHGAGTVSTLRSRGQGHRATDIVHDGRDRPHPEVEGQRSAPEPHTDHPVGRMAPHRLLVSGPAPTSTLWDPHLLSPGPLGYQPGV